MKYHTLNQLPWNSYGTLICRLIRLTKHTAVIQPMMKGYQYVQYRILRPAHWKGHLRDNCILDLSLKDGRAVLNKIIHKKATHDV